MQRILLVVAVLLVIWRVLAAIGKRQTERAPGADSFSRYSPEARRRRRQQAAENPDPAEDLVECSVCGTFVPAGRALTASANQFFCGDLCRHKATVKAENQGT
jgi:hypothetical protein